MKICFIGSYAPSLVNFRGPLIKELIKQKNEVYTFAPTISDKEDIEKKMFEMGAVFEPICLTRSKISPVSDIKTFFFILRKICKFKPDIIIAYTVKPIIYTGLVCGFFKIFLFNKKIKFFPLIEGLGYFFTKNKFIFKKYIFKQLIKFMYKVSLLSAYKIIFLNSDDENDFKKLSIISKKLNSPRINGCGVDLKEFPPSNTPIENNFLMLSRILADKGIREYCLAAEIVKSKYPNASFKIAGSFDSNPAGIKKNEFMKWVEKGVIEYLGNVNNVQPLLKNCKCYVLPSYREGLPRSVIEAMATGRPIITTDVPGCRDTVINNYNGFMVKSHNALELSKAMIKLINQSEDDTRKMGERSLKLARDKFDVIKVNKEIINILNI